MGVQGSEVRSKIRIRAASFSGSSGCKVQLKSLRGECFFQTTAGKIQLTHCGLVRLLEKRGETTL